MNKMEENGMKFICNKCNFKTLYNSNYQKHLTTARHKMETFGNNKMEENGTVNKCTCGKNYKTRSGLWKHKKTCTLSNKLTVTDNVVP